MDEELSIYTDGGARGNPGPGACAFVIKKGNEIVAKGSKFIGKVTNNFAEYSGVLLALEWMVKNLKEINNVPLKTFYLDSELVTKQLRGEYRVKNPSLIKISSLVNRIIMENKLSLSFEHIPRVKNKMADYLVNQKLDEQSTL